MPKSKATQTWVEVVVEFTEERETVRAEAARLLRHAADRIEQGQNVGGFYLSATDQNNGAFALITKKEPTS